MSIADELQLLINTKEQIRLAVGASKDVPFSMYVDLIDGNPVAQLTVDPALIGIERQTAILANTKESLRVALGLSTSIPFSQYASHIPPYEKTGTVFEFVNNQYSKDQMPVNLSEISEFIRLSSATMWRDEQLVKVGNSIPRISKEGLLIESQATNVIQDNTFTSAVVDSPNNVSLSDAVDDSIPDAKLLTSKVERFGKSGSRLTSLQSQGEYPLGVSSPTLQDGYHRSFIVKNSGGARYASLHHGDDSAFGGVIDFVEEVYVGSTGGSMRSLGGGWWELRLWRDPNSNTGGKRFRVAFGNTLDGNNLVIGIGDNVYVAYPSAYDAKDIDLSIIPTYGTAVTRSPDILNIPLLLNQTITGDWDAGVTYSVSDGIATFAGHGYIRNIIVEES